MGVRAALRAAISRLSLFLLALTLMIVAIARPQAVVMLPSQHETIILAMDVSGSMRAADVEPNRLVAAQNAAKAFVNDQPQHTRIGVVSFAGTAAVVQPPTQHARGHHRRDRPLPAPARHRGGQRHPRLAEDDLSRRRVRPSLVEPARSTSRSPRRSTRRRARTPKDPPKPVAPGSYQSAAIILLTDGQTTTGPDPIEAARIAAERGVRVFTVGIGTEKGEMIGAEGWSMRVRLDEASLKQIANITLGEYFYAGTANDLKKVYESLNSQARVRAAADRDHRAVRCRSGVVRGAGRHPLDALVRTHHVRVGRPRPFRRACSAFPRRA